MYIYIYQISSTALFSWRLCTAFVHETYFCSITVIDSESWKPKTYPHLPLFNCILSKPYEVLYIVRYTSRPESFNLFQRSGKETTGAKHFLLSRKGNDREVLKRRRFLNVDFHDTLIDPSTSASAKFIIFGLLDDPCSAPRSKRSQIKGLAILRHWIQLQSFKNLFETQP